MNTSQPPPPVSSPDNRNDDRGWVGGVFYVNPNDPRLLVEKRSGLGWTFNFANPLGGCLTGGLFAFLAFIQLLFFVMFSNPLNLVLLCLFLALSLPFFVVGLLHVRTSRQSLAPEAGIPTIARLKPSYSGQETSISGAVTLSIVEQSPVGHLRAKWILNELGREYPCKGTITPEGKITLTSTGSRDPVLQIHGSLTPDGHLEGILDAISKDGSSKRQSWSLG